MVLVNWQIVNHNLWCCSEIIRETELRLIQYSHSSSHIYNYSADCICTEKWKATMFLKSYGSLHESWSTPLWSTPLCLRMWSKMHATLLQWYRSCLLQLCRLSRCYDADGHLSWELFWALHSGSEARSAWSDNAESVSNRTIANKNKNNIKTAPSAPDSIARLERAWQNWQPAHHAMLSYTGQRKGILEKELCTSDGIQIIRERTGCNTRAPIKLWLRSDFLHPEQSLYGCQTNVWEILSWFYTPMFLASKHVLDL